MLLPWRLSSARGTQNVRWLGACPQLCRGHRRSRRRLRRGRRRRQCAPVGGMLTSSRAACAAQDPMQRCTVSQSSLSFSFSLSSLLSLSLSSPLTLSLSPLLSLTLSPLLSLSLAHPFLEYYSRSLRHIQNKLRTRSTTMTGDSMERSERERRERREREREREKEREGERERERRGGGRREGGERDSILHTRNDSKSLTSIPPWRRWNRP